MPRIFLTAALLVAFMASAQPHVRVKSMSKVTLPQGTYVENHTLSPDGQFVVISDGNTISQVDLSTRKTKKIADAPNAYDMRVTPDGSTVVYYQPSFQEDLRHVALKSASTSGGSVKTLLAPSRHLSAGVSVTDNAVSAVENGQLRRTPLKSSAKTPVKIEAVAAINYGHLEVTVEGVTRTIDPQGQSSYLWPSISPDGTKVLYWCCGDGCFVCDLNGNNVRPIGLLRAAVWAGNDLIVGMEDYDDGYVVTSSRIVASDLNGNKVALTEDELIAMYPSASANGRRVTFTTGDTIYVLNLETE